MPQLALFYSKAVMLFSHECANKKLTHLIFFYLSQAIFSPASFLLWCSSSEPGYLQPQMATNTMKPPVHIMAFMFPVVNHMITKLDIIVNTIAYLNLVGNTLFSPQFLRNGPNNLWFIIQLCIRSLLFAKQKAAPTAGVDQGSPGRYTPMKAMTNKIHPKANHSAFFRFKFFNIVFPLFYTHPSWTRLYTFLSDSAKSCIIASV